MKDAFGLFDALDRYARVPVERGRVQLDAADDDYEYVRLRRFAVAILESVDRALGVSPLEPAHHTRTRPPAGFHWTDSNEHDPGIVLVELLAYVADTLTYYADRVASENRRRTRRRAVAAAALVALAWCCARRRQRA